MKMNPRPAAWTVLLCAILASPIGRAEEPMSEVIDNSFAAAAGQYRAMLERIAGDKERLPRSFERGEVVLVPPIDWTSGFFPGSLWLLFEQTGDPAWKEAAAGFTARLESVKDATSTHDLGFMLYCSYGEGLRLTGDPAYRDVLVQGARSLASRFNPKVGLIRSWDFGEWSYPVIIDNMMNLELLMFAAEQTGEARFREIAVSHANRTMREHYRPDGSCWHVVDYDPETGAVVGRQTWQGHDDDSAWARGQAWGLYGFVTMHRLTRDPAYLAQARRIASYILSHPRLPADGIPYWDFDAPGIPDVPRDASAGAIMASALIELGGLVEGEEAAAFLGLAEKQLRSLASPAYLAGPGENGNFIVKHCVGHMGAPREVDAPLAYADYYFLEALKRWKQRL